MARSLLLLLALAPLVRADWPRFRGPNGSGLGDAPAVPLKWTEKDFAWKVHLPGLGHSSPVVFGERIFVTSAEPGGKRLVLCLHRDDGRLLWRKEFAGAPYKKHPANSFATSTPAVDAARLYLFWGAPAESSVLALDHAGNTVWERPLGPYPSQHGLGISPILHDGLVIVHHQPDGLGTVFALDAKDGAVKWTTPRKGKQATYATPCVYQPPGKPAEIILTNWQHGITGLDPKTGKVKWEKSVFEPDTQQRSIASPVVAGDLVLGIAGFAEGDKRLVAVRPGENGKEAWRFEAAVPQMATPLFEGDRVYLVTELGMATCLKAGTGEVVWRQRVRGNYRASPVGIGDRIYCPASDGRVLVLAASDRFTVLADNPLGGPTQSTPAIAGGRIYFRTEGHLIALGAKKRD